MRDLELRRQLNAFGSNRNKPVDPPTEAQKKAAAQKRAQENANKNLSNLGENTGGPKNKRTVSGSSSYVKKGQKVERQAKTPEEIAAWKKSTPEQRSKYQDKKISVNATASDFGKNKPADIPTEVPKPKGTGMFFTYASNEHNMRFGGNTETGYHEGKPDRSYFSDSYTTSPKNPISGRPNEYKSREMTSDEFKVYKSRFNRYDASPYTSTPKQWNDYISGGLKHIGRLEVKKQEKAKVQATLSAIKQGKRDAVDKKIADKAENLKIAKGKQATAVQAKRDALSKKKAAKAEKLRIAKENQKKQRNK